MLPRTLIPTTRTKHQQTPSVPFFLPSFSLLAFPAPSKVGLREEDEKGRKGKMQLQQQGTTSDTKTTTPDSSAAAPAATDSRTSFASTERRAALSLTLSLSLCSALLCVRIASLPVCSLLLWCGLSVLFASAPCRSAPSLPLSLLTSLSTTTSYSPLLLWLTPAPRRRSRVSLPASSCFCLFVFCFLLLSFFLPSCLSPCTRSQYRLRRRFLYSAVLPQTALLLLRRRLLLG